MAIRSYFLGADDEVSEGSWSVYTTTLVQPDGSPIPAAYVSGLTLTLYVEEKNHEIINDIDHVDILNTGREALSVDGVLAVTLEGDDHGIADDRLDVETHIMLIEGLLVSGRVFRHEVAFSVRNLVLVTVTVGT